MKLVFQKVTKDVGYSIVNATFKDSPAEENVKRVDSFDVKVMNTFFQRFAGLQLKKSLLTGTGYYFPRCNSIHCFNMRFPIDVIYFDKDMKVIYIETVKPWHIGKVVHGGDSLLEINQGESNRVKTALQGSGQLIHNIDK